jgi:N-acetylmuramoyl-L-alanine amidase
MALWKEELVVVNKYSRPGIKLLSVKGIVIHWTANPGGTDEGHQDFFDGADGGGSRYASAHIFVDKDSATLMIPLNEVAYHANEKSSKIAKLKATAPYYQNGNANLTTIGIEMCVEKDGTIHPDTAKRTAQITAYLVKTYGLSVNDVYRHFDITGKNCPAPWVASPALFVNFKNDVVKILTPPKTVHVYTGGYGGEALATIQGHIAKNKWWYQPTRNPDGTISFLIGGFNEGSEAVKQLESFLKERNWWYQIK